MLLGNMEDNFAPFQDLIDGMSFLDSPPFCQCEDNCSLNCLHKVCNSDGCKYQENIDAERACHPTDTCEAEHEAQNSEEDFKNKKEKHIHDLDCGHEAILHEGHIDYLVDSHLHHQHGDHCHDHGVVNLQNFFEFQFCDCPDSCDNDTAQSSPKSPSPGAATHDPSILFAVSSTAHQDKSLSLSEKDLVLTNSFSSCKKCKKKKISEVHKTRLTEEAAKAKTILVLDSISKFVKTKHQKNFSIDSPIHHLKGVTTDTATKMKQGILNYLGVTCDHIQGLSILTDEQIKILKSNDAQLFRNIQSMCRNAKTLIELIESEAAFKKRAKNAACCHRFREKKKQKVEQWQETIKEMSVKCEDLQIKLLALEREKAELHNILMGQGIN